MGIMSVLWVICVYAICFGDNVHSCRYGWNNQYFLLLWIDNSIMLGDILEYVFSMFQGKFAIITPALIVRASAKRISFKAYCFFIALWGSLVYNSLYHWVCASDSFSYDLGAKSAINFAVGSVVRISASISGLVVAFYIKARRRYPKTVM